ncbi:unnamed protein product [Parascedosporium putredinis]|uniref:Copper acquisition factor BIM1-like domain-containing protein n=1 Tax=Parascedosporium putredinis TaxID=1442378 RepID=A0A9P1H7X5_9PEZI|nr:unnamed protein product [Parascedosporium putredinis]CAI8000144.1 unnamed protein product [Parascedosporium putredinis]
MDDDVAPSLRFLASSENSLSSGPCGGAKIDFDAGTVTDFHVGGDAIAATGTHPQANWLFRATTDLTGTSNWTQLYPIVEQSGLGKLCQPKITVPEEWVDKQGLISVVAHAEDGVLYGCSQVKFVEGTGEQPSSCRNTTENFSFTSDSDLEALVDDGTGSSGSNSSDSSGGSGDDNSNSDDSGSSGDEGAASNFGTSFVGMVSAAALVAGVLAL